MAGFFRPSSGRKLLGVKLKHVATMAAIAIVAVVAYDRVLKPKLG